MMKIGDNLNCNSYNYSDKIFLENVYLLEELKGYPIDQSSRKIIKRLRKEILDSIINIMYALEEISKDEFGFTDENGAINISKWNIYFDLAIELKIKILIPRNITIEEYIDGLV